MDETKMKELINMYFDGELDKGEETLLFSGLAESSESRKYFKQLGRIRSAVEETTEEFPQDLEERILRSAGSLMVKKPGPLSRQKITAVISYAAVLIMLFLTAFILVQMNQYRDKIDDLSGRMERQSETIKMFYNSLPGIEVRAASENEIIIKPSL